MSRSSVNRAHPQPERPAEQRTHDFAEVQEGYDLPTAVAEARRCRQCRTKPCVLGCPVNVDIPGFIGLLRQEKIEQAAALLHRHNLLPAVCGRVCPQERQCEARCILGRRGNPVRIGALERFLGDWLIKRKAVVAAERRLPREAAEVAVIGSGPAGLTCAAELIRHGHRSTVFEALHTPGGVLAYGIPRFRLPRRVLEAEIRNLLNMGVEIKTNILVGKTLGFDELADMGYKAVFIGGGAGLPRFLDIPGEELPGVFSANELLTRVNLMEANRFPEVDTPLRVGDTAVVVGGGNTAMDAARVLRRLGSQVTILYRRSRDELPARAAEIRHAEEEDVRFRFLAAPLRILSGPAGEVAEVECIGMRLGDPDRTGRPQPQVVVGSEFRIPANTVVIAVGQEPSPLLRSSCEVEFDDRGRIVVDPKTCQTSRPGVFAGGDIAGGGTVIAAMGAGKRAALSIHSYLEELSAKQ